MFRSCPPRPGAFLRPVCLAVFALTTGAAALAGPAGRPAPPAGWQWSLGAGLIANPRFQGSDQSRVFPVPYFEGRYLDRKGTRFFASVPRGLGGYVFRHRGEGPNVDVGFALAPGFANRDEEDVPGLPEFGPAAEARAYLEIGTRRWGLTAALSQAVATGHEGAYADLSATRRWRLGRQGFVSVGPSVRIGDGTYNGALYDVPEAFVGSSGLPAYRAGAGVESVALAGLLSVPVSGPWRVTVVARAGRLVGTAADSPVVRDETQLFGLVALTRRF